MTILIDDDKRVEWIRMSGIPEALDILGVQVKEFSEKAKRENMKFKERNKKLKELRSRKQFKKTKAEHEDEEEKAEHDEENEEKSLTSKNLSSVVDKVLSGVVEPIIGMADSINNKEKDVHDVVDELSEIANILLDEVIEPLIEAIDEVEDLEKPHSVTAHDEDDDEDDLEKPHSVTAHDEEEMEKPHSVTAHDTDSEEIEEVIDVLVEEVLNPLMEVAEELQKSVKSINKRMDNFEKTTNEKLKSLQTTQKDLDEIPVASASELLKQRILKRFGTNGNEVNEEFNSPLNSDDKLLKQKPKEAEHNNAGGFGGFLEGK